MILLFHSMPFSSPWTFITRPFRKNFGPEVMNEWKSIGTTTFYIICLWLPIVIALEGSFHNIPFQSYFALSRGRMTRVERMMWDYNDAREDEESETWDSNNDLNFLIFSLFLTRTLNKSLGRGKGTGIETWLETGEKLEAIIQFNDLHLVQFTLTSIDERFKKVYYRERERGGKCSFGLSGWIPLFHS